ncbi:MAG: hypothetical protein WBG58_03750, partial [Ignavibacteriaceae bacterium]
MKTLFFIFVTIIVYSNLILPQGWECQDCPKRDLAFFDLDIWQREPPEPGSGLDQADWLEMFMVAGGILDALFNEDPSNDCINFYDGQMVTINEWGEDNYTHGSTSLSLPPLSGMSEDIEYLVSGLIAKQKSDGVYIITAIVQTGGTGETVVEATTPYDFSISGVQNGKNIAQQLMPVMQHIRDFEKGKRDEIPEVVIAPDGKGAEKEIKPEKEKIKAGETTKVEIKIIDCDGVPIKDMDVTLTGEGGSFNPEKVKTDGDGKAESKFTADCDPGKYTLTMEFKARFPYSFKENEFGETKEIEIEAGDKFNIVYNHTMSHEYGGQFLLESIGTGTIPCTINWEADPPTVKGEGTVNATWTGNAAECKFVGNSSYKLNYKGKVVYSEDGSATLQLKKISDSEQGGNFNIICGTITQ